MRSALALFVSILYVTIFISCSDSTPVETETEETTGEYMDIVASLDFDTLKEERYVRIGNYSFLLQIHTYSLNDSGLVKGVEDSDGPGYLVMYHQYESEITLGAPDTIINFRFRKSDCADSLGKEFSELAQLHEVKFEFVRSNRLYFTADFWTPDTDFVKSGMFAIFFRTNKKGQLDCWQFSEPEIDPTDPIQ